LSEVGFGLELAACLHWSENENIFPKGWYYWGSTVAKRIGPSKDRKSDY